MKIAAFLFGAVLLLPAASHADEIEEQIATALEYYQAGDVNDAITELQFTISAMQSQLAKGYEAVFPEPMAGWSADPVETAAGAAFMGGGSILMREYRSDDGGSVSAQLMVDNPMIQTFAAMMANPAMLAMQPGAERLRVGRENAVMTFDDSAGEGEVTLVMAGRVMLKLEGRGLRSKAPLVDLIEAFDFSTLKSIAGIQ